MAGLFDIKQVDYGDIPSLADLNMKAAQFQSAKMQLEKMKTQDAMLKSMQSQFMQGQQPQAPQGVPQGMPGMGGAIPPGAAPEAAAAGGKRNIPLGQLIAMYSLTGDTENAKRVADMGNSIYKELVAQNPQAASAFWNTHLAPIYGVESKSEQMKQDVEIKDVDGTLYRVNKQTGEAKPIAGGMGGPKDDDLFLAYAAEKQAKGEAPTAGDLARLEQIKTKMVLGATKAGMTEAGNAWQYVPGVGPKLQSLVGWAQGGAPAAVAGAKPSIPSAPAAPRVAVPTAPVAMPGAAGQQPTVTRTQVGPMSVFKPSEPNLAGGTKEAMEKQLDQVGQTLATVDTVANNFQDKFLTFENRLQTGWSALKERMGQQLGQDEKKELGDYSRWARNSISLINQHIKQMTGAAMSEPEAQRLVKQMPNPGTNPYNMDSPTEFKTKLTDLRRELMMIQARANYARANNLNWKDINYEQMPAIMNARASQMAQALKSQNPSIPDDELRREVSRRVANEFGIARVGR